MLPVGSYRDNTIFELNNYHNDLVNNFYEIYKYNIFIFFSQVCI